MPRLWLALALAGILLTQRGFSQEVPSSPEFYLAHVKPIFQANCYRCHGGINRQGRLNIETKAGIYRGGREVVIVPGDPAHSLLVTLIRHEGTGKKPMPMPPKSKLSDTDISTVTRWIEAGAIMPDDPPKRLTPPSAADFVLQGIAGGLWSACGGMCGGS